VIPADEDASAPHIVSLTPQALTILEVLRPLTGHIRYVFAGERSVTLARYPKTRSTRRCAAWATPPNRWPPTASGAMASTMLHELGYPPHVIEAQLAHAQRNQVAAVYNRAEYLPERAA